MSKITLQVVRTADPNRYELILRRPDNNTESGPYRNAGFLGNTTLTLVSGPTAGKKGIRFETLPNLEPGQTFASNEWTLGTIEGEEWIEVE